MDAIVAIHGRRVTMAPQPRLPASFFGAACSRPAASLRAQARLETSLVPMKPSSAGVSVMAIITAIATVNAAEKPRMPRNGRPGTASAESAMTTVRPANTTALPLVPVARAIDSPTGTPSSSCRRCRCTMNSE